MKLSIVPLDNLSSAIFMIGSIKRVRAVKEKQQQVLTYKKFNLIGFEGRVEAHFTKREHIFDCIKKELCSKTT